MQRQRMQPSSNTCRGQKLYKVFRDMVATGVSMQNDSSSAAEEGFVVTDETWNAATFLTVLKAGFTQFAVVYNALYFLDP